MLLVVAMICSVPFIEPLRDSVTVAERNEYFDLDGRQVFTQWIYSDHDRIQAWRLEKDFIRQWHPPALIWLDEGRMRRVTAGSWAATMTQVDREVAERDAWPKEARRGLQGEKR